MTTPPPRFEAEAARTTSAASTLRQDDLGALSSTVAGVLAATPSQVTASQLASEILNRHREYGGRSQARPVLPTKGAPRRDRRAWLADVRALFDRDAAPRLHGRLVIIGLARLDRALQAALDDTGFTEALAAELKESLAALWARPAVKSTAAGAAPTATEQEDRLWAQLSPSSRAALEHATALSDDEVVHTEHLLLGLYLEDDGPTRGFFDWFGVTRAMLDRALTEAVEVQEMSPRKPTELHAMPPVSRHVARALANAAEFAAVAGSSTVRSRHLFHGLLEVEDCDVTRALASLEVTATAFRTWLQRQGIDSPSGHDGPNGGDQPPPPEGNDLEQFARAVLAGGIAADLVDPDKGIPANKDDLGVSTYVAMMATAIAGTDTKLPLSIGLFGEWGSGKSYFMGLLRQQVKKLASSKDPAYHEGIVQIGFNAWSYADANLWASLGDEIFRELAGPSDEEGGNEEQRARLRERLRDEQSRVTELEAAKESATAEVARLRGELQRREPDRRKAALGLLSATLSVVQDEKADELRTAWKRLGVNDETEQARLLANAVTDTADAVTTVRHAARPGRRRYLVAAAVALGLVSVVIGLLSSGAVRQWLTGTGVTALLTTGVAVAATMKRIAEGARSVAGVADQIRQRTEAGENETVKAAVDEVRKAEAREEVLQAQLSQVVARVGELGRELVELTPGQRLYAFLAERAASDDYRGQLGLIATIRRDFERLARLQKALKKARKEGRGADLPEPIDRIVLYIDDLDRCSPRQVVEVLQAVHLLLALDLFVVVVGVDPRWLLHSLRDQYRSTLTGTVTAARAEGDAGETARRARDDTVQDDADRLMLSTPHDYLEKIFNVPFVLPAMTPKGFDAMIRRLSIVEPAADRAVAPERDQQDADVEPAVEPPIRSDVSQSLPGGETTRPEAIPAPAVEAGSKIDAVQRGETVAPTPLTEPELHAISSLAPLVRSPREAKRLLNLYRMLRSTKDLSDASRFLGADPVVGEFRAVAMLLGLLSANPRLLGQMLFAPPDSERGLLGGICSRTAPTSWPVFVDGMRPRDADGRWHNDLCADLSDEDRAEWAQLVERAGPASALITLADLTAFAAWAPHVARFSFLLAPASWTAPAVTVGELSCR